MYFYIIRNIYIIIYLDGRLTGDRACMRIDLSERLTRLTTLGRVVRFVRGGVTGTILAEEDQRLHQVESIQYYEDT